LAEYKIELNDKQNKLLREVMKQHLMKDVKKLFLKMLIESKMEPCPRCGYLLTCGSKLCYQCGKLFSYEGGEIDAELKALDYKVDNPIVEFYEPDVKRFSKLTEEGKIETDVATYLKEKKEAIK